MRYERKTAITVGVLYIAVTVAGVTCMAIGGLGDLGGLAAHVPQFFGSLGFVFLMAVGAPAIAIMLYPVLKADADTPSKQGLALLYVASRIMECAIFIAGFLFLIALFALQKELGAGAAASAGVAAMSAAMRSAYEYSAVLAQTVFCLGALMLYWLLYVSKRVPRWLCIWGFIAVPMMIVSGFLLPVTGDPNAPISTALYAPIFFQEMALAVWLIARGFRVAGVADAPASPALEGASHV